MSEIAVHTRTAAVLRLAIALGVFAAIAFTTHPPEMPDPVPVLIGWVLVALAAATLLMLVRSGTMLRISENGLSIRYWFILNAHYAWERCSAFEPRSPKFPLGEELGRHVHFTATVATGRLDHVQLADLWELQTDELAAELNRRREAALARSVAPAPRPSP
jgi:hypothetical protein